MISVFPKISDNSEWFAIGGRLLSSVEDVMNSDAVTEGSTKAMMQQTATNTHDRSRSWANSMIRGAHTRYLNRSHANLHTRGSWSDQQHTWAAHSRIWMSISTPCFNKWRCHRPLKRGAPKKKKRYRLPAPFGFRVNAKCWFNTWLYPALGIGDSGFHCW